MISRAVTGFVSSSPTLLRERGGGEEEVAHGGRVRLLEMGREGGGRGARAAGEEAVACLSLMRCGRKGGFADDGYCGVRPFECFFPAVKCALGG
jgi:hypothetical protein